MARNKQMMSYRQENETAPTTVAPRAAQPTYEQIQARAYEIFLARGSNPGTAADDWVQAELELKAARGSVDE